MYKVTWNVYWGTRFQDTFHTLYFSRKPSNDEILQSFARHGWKISPNFHQPRNGGMVVVTKIEVEF